jgi:hypothetical protein
MSEFIPMKSRLSAAREKVEREAIGEALIISGGNVTAAARLLDISRKSLQLRMKRWDIYVEKPVVVSQACQLKTPDRIIQDCAAIAVREAVRNGILVRPEVCEICDKSPRDGVVAHHPDYSRPLEVEWLCRSCHTAKHLTG